MQEHRSDVIAKVLRAVKGGSKSENVLLEAVIEWLLFSLWTTCFAGQTYFLGTSVQRVQAVPLQTEKCV